MKRLLLLIALTLFAFNTNAKAFTFTDAVPYGDGDGVLTKAEVQKQLSDAGIAPNALLVAEGDNSIKSIESDDYPDDGVFAKCSLLTKADFPAVETIGDYAFWNCFALETVSFPEVITIEHAAFFGCYSLTSLTAENFPKVTEIGGQAFFGCTGLEEVTLPAVKTIGGSAFWAAPNTSVLATVSFPNVETIGNDAFWNCDKLTEVSFPNVETIGNWAFWNCDALAKVSLGTGFIIQTEINIGENIFRDVETEDITLILGENVSPPRTAGNTWNGITFGDISRVGYYELTLQVSPANAGTLSDTKPEYAEGAAVEITATAKAGYEFVNWTDEDTDEIVSTNNTHSFNISKNTTLKANFKATKKPFMRIRMKFLND
jgi:uncharacterized repeat protein (TIGR02543 family)